LVYSSILNNINYVPGSNGLTESHAKQKKPVVTHGNILRQLWQRIWGRDALISASVMNGPPKLVARKKGNANVVAVGFANSGNNCWLNALLQLIKSVPAYEEAYRTIAREAIAAGNHKSPYGKALLNAFVKYDASLAAQKAVPSAVSQAVRGAFHHLISSDISPYASEQYDASEALMHMMRTYGEILEKRKSPLPSNLFTPIITKRQYAAGEEILTDKRYTPISGESTIEEKQLEFQIILSLQGNFGQRSGKCSFDTLWNNYFDNPRAHESDPVIFEGADHKVRKYQPVSEQRQFAAVPEQFALVLNRTGMSREKGVYKIDVPIDVPQTLVLDQKATGIAQLISYKLVGTILHSGPYGGGHYIALKKVGNDLVECNDSQSKFVDDNHMRNLANQRSPFTGYVYHYIKIDK
jgi:ubiquitin C-terminal hydrolase